MAKLPSLQFYPGDWLRDDVSACSLAAQGLWLRMMIVAHDSANYGFLEVNGLPMPREMIARKCGCGIEEFDGLMAELDSAGVPSRAANGAIYSRRMVRDGAQRQHKSKKRSEAGKAGAEARWQNDGKTMASAMANDMAKNGSSSSSSTSTSVEDKKPPNPQRGNEDLLKMQVFVNEWNLCDGVVHCRQLTANRIKTFSARCRDPGWDWQTAIRKFPLKCFADSESNWKPDIDWFLRPDTVLKIIEGKYDWEKSDANRTNGTNGHSRERSRLEGSLGAIADWMRDGDESGVRDSDREPLRIETNR